MALVEKIFVQGPPVNLAQTVGNAETITWEKTTCNGRPAEKAIYDDAVVETSELVPAMGAVGMVVDVPE